MTEMAAEIRRGHRVTGGGGNFGIPESLCLLGSSLADRGVQTLAKKKCFLASAGTVCRQR